MSMHTWLGDAWGLFGILAALAFLALVVLAVAALLRSDGRRRPQRSRGSPALRLLEERYARGELTRQEFLERREVLINRAPVDEP
jgi:putative membrane protein